MQSKNKSGRDRKLSPDEVVSVFMEMAVTSGVQQIFSRWHIYCTSQKSSSAL